MYYKNSWYVLKRKIERVANKTMEIIGGNLYRRDIGGGMHHAIKIQEEMISLSYELKTLRVIISYSGGVSQEIKAEDGYVTKITGTFIRIYKYGGQFNLVQNIYKLQKVSYSFFQIFTCV